VNRWAHGYAYTPNSLFDSDWKEEEKPWVIGRQPFGKIAIANSDADASAYLDVAIVEKPEKVGPAGEDRFPQNELDGFRS
jgi:spermidine dehydrogenase